MKNIFPIFFMFFPYISVAGEIDFKGASHQINFPSAKIVLGHGKEDYSERNCFFDTKLDSYFHWGGKLNERQEVYFFSGYEPLIRGHVKPKYKNRVQQVFNPKYVPIRVSTSWKNDNGYLSKSDRVEKFVISPEGTLVWDEVDSYSTLKEAVCFATKIEMTNKNGGKLVFNSTLVRSWKKPFLAFLSCIEGSGNFEFENKRSDFSKYNDIGLDCWWE